MGSQSLMALDLDDSPTFIYVVRLNQRAFQVPVFHMFVSGDCNVVVKALEPLIAVRSAHDVQ